MTNDFKRLAGQLAMGMNFDENAVIMATQIDNDNKNAEVNVYFNGQRRYVRTLIIEIIKRYLSNFDGEEASLECGALMTAFTRADESNVQPDNGVPIALKTAMESDRHRIQEIVDILAEQVRESLESEE